MEDWSIDILIADLGEGKESEFKHRRWHNWESHNTKN